MVLAQDSNLAGGMLVLLAMIALVWVPHPFRVGDKPWVAHPHNSLSLVAPARWLMLLWVLFVLGGPLVLSALARPVFVPRYAISVCVPATVGLIVFADRFSRAALIGTAAVMVLLNAVGTVVRFTTMPARPNGLHKIIDHLNHTATDSDVAVVVDMPFCPNYINPVEMGFEYYGLRPDIRVLHLRGNLGTGLITQDGALNDPRNLHIITILGDVETALKARGRKDYISYALEPYRYFQVRGSGVEPPVPFVLE